jgi:hypothetical protein
MAMPRPNLVEWLRDVAAYCRSVTSALGALVEPAQADAVDAIVRAAMTGFTERFTHYP